MVVLALMVAVSGHHLLAALAVLLAINLIDRD